MKRIIVATGVAVLVAGLWGSTHQQPLLAQGKTTTAVDLRGVTQNWDKLLPANDPGGPCPSSSSRFTCVFNGAAVRDNETGLVWEQSPTTYTFSWDSARYMCINHTTGGRKGWRLPTVNEVASLIDPTQVNPALPPGHPFTNVVAGYNGYWTESSDEQGGSPTAVAWAITFYDGYIGLGDKSYSSHIWCVRGGSNPDRY